MFNVAEVAKTLEALLKKFPILENSPIFLRGSRQDFLETRTIETLDELHYTEQNATRQNHTVGFVLFSSADRYNVALPRSLIGLINFAE